MSVEWSPHSPLDLSPLDGEVNYDGPALDAAADDFGHLVRRVPLAVLRPHSGRDIAVAVRWATERGSGIAARGQGHSIYGRSQVDGGIVIDMNALNQIHDVAADRVVVDAGATWRTVLDAALPRGLTPPVLTNYLDLSVGGTLSVGGIGGTTHRYGLQTDNVLELEVVTGDGRQLTCSADERADLFDAVRAGLGQFGIITRATLALVPAPDRVRRYTLAYSALAALASDQRRILKDKRADHLQGTILARGGGWQHLLEIVTFAREGEVPRDDKVLADLADDRGQAQLDDLTYAEHARNFDRFEPLLRATGDWSNPHPWWLTFLPGSAAEHIASDVLAELAPSDLGQYGTITFYPITTAQITTPLFRLPAENVVFPFNLVRFPPDDPTQAAQLVSQNRALYDRVRAAGGVLYPVSGFPLAPADWQEHFGDLWPAVRSAKQRFDPRQLLTPGQGLFVADRGR
jgi:FAD/FMN-containing dehydrogenase